MNRDKNDYLVPLLLAEGSLPMGRLLYHATGEAFPGGTVPGDVHDDLDELNREGTIRIETKHSARHRRMEKTVYLTWAGYEAREKLPEAECIEDYAEKEAGMEGAKMMQRRLAEAGALFFTR